MKKITLLAILTILITTISCNNATNKKPNNNGHDYVDLGLPSGTLWAKCNIGATTPEEYGEYFAWGEITSKESYSVENYKYCNASETALTKYCTDAEFGTLDNKKLLDIEDDIARANLGGDWRMPTKAEIEELINECAIEWLNQNGVNGYKVTGPNGNSIFLPAAGFRIVSSINFEGSCGCYWSASLNEITPSNAYRLYINSENFTCNGYIRYFGQSIRAVCSANAE